MVLYQTMQNEYVKKGGFLLYGGTGFAKYDEVWNANSIVCCPNFSREDEIKETTMFLPDGIGLKKILYVCVCMMLMFQFILQI